jgi:exodeoxyribonuclease VII small subunit
MSAAPESGEPTFAHARARLDEILDELESRDADVDQLAARVKEASELIRFCSERLATTRQQVKRIVAEMAAAESAEQEGTAGGNEDAGTSADAAAGEPWPEADEAPAEGEAPARPAPGKRRQDPDPGELPF